MERVRLSTMRWDPCSRCSVLGSLTKIRCSRLRSYKTRFFGFQGIPKALKKLAVGKRRRYFFLIFFVRNVRLKLAGTGFTATSLYTPYEIKSASPQCRASFLFFCPIRWRKGLRVVHDWFKFNKSCSFVSHKGGVSSCRAIRK